MASMAGNENVTLVANLLLFQVKTWGTFAKGGILTKMASLAMATAVKAAKLL
jgi:hypothetical protein